MDIWEIRLNSDECQYCRPPLKYDKIYRCYHPENYTKKCGKSICPIINKDEIDNNNKYTCIDEIEGF